MDIFSVGKPQELHQILTVREDRAERIQELLERYQGSVLCFKLNIPGPIKNNSFIRKVFQEGELAIEQALSSLGEKWDYKEEKESQAGDELYLVFENFPPLELKKQMCKIEEEHYFGRLFDMDVITLEGSISRTQLNMPQRSCLICNQRAVDCGRNRTHSVEELQDKINQMVQERELFLP